MWCGGVGLDNNLISLLTCATNLHISAIWAAESVSESTDKLEREQTFFVLSFIFLQRTSSPYLPEQYNKRKPVIQKPNETFIS